MIHGVCGGELIPVKDCPSHYQCMGCASFVIVGSQMELTEIEKVNKSRQDGSI